MICANLDSLEVYVGRKLLATVTPDTTDYGNLPYPPSFVDFSAVDGSALPELRIDGYLAGRKVASRRFDADPSHDRLELIADDTVIDADGSDATRVAFRAVDRHGNAPPVRRRAGHAVGQGASGAGRGQPRSTSARPAAPARSGSARCPGRPGW